MRIALDAMGGDFAPEPNVAGAIAALKADDQVEVVLVGDESRLESSLEKFGESHDRLTIKHADSVVEMDEKPTAALRRKPNSSIAICWRLMAARDVEAVVSAGNTGAVVAAGLRTRLYLSNVKRPGIAVSLPTLNGQSVLIDVGANPAARPEHLYQYGVMGAVYAREMLGIEQPRVGLMNIGSEDTKGNDLYRETHRFLISSSLSERYVGNVEGRGLYRGEADVLICEGFVGNVVLKVSEGMAEFMMKTVAQEVIQQLDGDRVQATRAFHELARRYQYREAGGAPLLGIDGICIICHGGSDDCSIANAIRGAARFQDRDINSQIVAELAGETVPAD